MKVRIEPGRVVELDAYRTTSIRGGVYDISELSAADQERILAISGVTTVRGKAPRKED